MTSLSEQDLRFFTTTVLRCFGVSTGIPATVAAAYLATGEVPTREFTGLITLSGAFRGHVMFTAPRLLLRDYLLRQGERDVDDPNLLDAVGEIANTIAGNARARYGDALQVAPPLTLRGGGGTRARVRAHPLLIALRWSHHEATVCIDLERV